MGDRAMPRAAAALAFVIAALALGLARFLSGAIGLDGTAVSAVACMIAAVFLAAPWLEGE